MKKIKTLSYILFVFVAFVLFFATLTATLIWGQFSFEQVLIHTNPAGVPKALVYKMLAGALLPSLVLLCFTSFYKKSRRIILLLSVIGLVWSAYKTSVFQYVLNMFQETEIYKDEYVYPLKTTFQFPKQKRNLIVLYMESFEELPYLKEIEALPDGVSFDGFWQLPDSAYTISAMVQGFCAIPYIVKPAQNFESMQNFLSKAVCYPEILRENGYETSFLKAFDLDFTRTGTFLKLHGFNEAIGKEILDESFSTIIPKGPWGLADSDLYEIAKKKLTALSKQKKPFLFAMLTLDTHFPMEYLDSKCTNQFHDERDVNICADQMAADFVRWIQAQDFYKNTTVVVLGDHPSYLSEDENRQIFNRFFNMAPNDSLKPHQWTTLDIAPTILNAIGIKMPENAFGLGRSVLGSNPTLLEKYGKPFGREIRKSSPEYAHFEEKTVQNNPLYKPYPVWGENIVLAEKLSKYATFFKEVMGGFYLDTLSFTLPEVSTTELILDLDFRIMFTAKDNKEIKIFANGTEVASKAYSAFEKQPYHLEVKIPTNLLNDKKLLLEIKSDALGFTPAASGVGLVNLSIRPD